VALALPPEIAAVRGTLTLGISEEPPGGSPTGRPSGRVFGTVDIPGVTGTQD
jgi:anti-sigma-K factor RskA